MLNKLYSTSMKKKSIQSLFGFRFDHFDLVVGFVLADTDAAVSSRIAGLAQLSWDI